MLDAEARVSGSVIRGKPPARPAPASLALNVVSTACDGLAWVGQVHIRLRAGTWETGCQWAERGIYMGPVLSFFCIWLR